MRNVSNNTPHCSCLRRLGRSYSVAHLPFNKPDLGEIAANIFFIILLSLIAVGLTGFTTDPAQESTAEIQQSAADSVAIHTIQIIENDGSVSFEYRGNADVEIWPDHITLHDDDEM